MKLFLQKKTIFKYSALITFSFIILISCKTVKEDYTLELSSDYLLLQPGKQFIYQLDSIVFTKQGRDMETRSYQEKHLIDAQITDNLGRTSFRVFRYIRDIAGSENWKNSGTYFITPTVNSVEVIENNLRVVKLVTPIKDGNFWKGNRYLANEPYKELFTFSNDDFMKDWDFEYKGLNDIYKYNGKELKNVLTVLQVDERTSLDTINVTGNSVTIPTNSTSIWLRGNASDTIIVNANTPSFGKENLTIYNRTNRYISLNNIKVPPGFSFSFQFANGKWNYPNIINVVNNKVTLPRFMNVAYIFGAANDSIKADASKLDTVNRTVTIYNKSNFDLYVNLNSALSKIGITPGFARKYEYVNNNWQLFENRNFQFAEDEFSTTLPFGNTSYSIEKYAKGFGLVYQELLLWEFQPNSNGTSYTTGFGVKRTLIDHN
jgi:hypothetical protein